MKLTQEQIKKLCESGGMAPSGGNIQPWKVEAYDNVLELKLDPVRSSSFLDVGQLASVFSLGSFFENLSITASSLGLSFDTKFQEFKTIDDAVVRIIFKDIDEKVKDHPLESSISKRTTNRQMFDGTIIDKVTISALEKEVSDFNSEYKLTCLSNYDKKEQVIKILGKADGVRTLNDTLHKQMFDELRWTDSESNSMKDGIDIATMELPANAPVLLKQMKDHPFVRHLMPRKIFEDMAKPLLRGSSHLCVLSMSTKPDVKSMFLAGQILERIWLTATKLDLALHPWTVFTFFLLRVEHFSGEGFNKKEKEEIIHLGKELREHLGLSAQETPLFIFRLSKARPPSARSLRLPWQDYTKVKS